MSRKRTSSHVIKHPRVTQAIVFFLMAVLWILLVSGVKGQEMLVGLGSVVLSFLFLTRIAHRSPLPIDFRVRDIAAGWVLPWQVCHDAWVVLVVLARSFMGERPESLFRVTGFNAAPGDPQRNARQVLATVYTTTTPNAIVLGVDADQSRMLIHQLRRAKTTDLLRRLGARS